MSTRAQLLTAVAADFPTNGAEEISAEDLRGNQNDLINSVCVPSSDYGSGIAALLALAPGVVGGTFKRAAVPASAGAVGTASTIAFDGDYIYFCIASGN